MNNIKSVVARFARNLVLDLPPQTAAEVIDFGFNYADDEQRLYAAYQRGLCSSAFSIYDLNEAVGDGPKLTALLAKVDPTIKVATDYDMMEELFGDE